MGCAVTFINNNKFLFSEQIIPQNYEFFNRTQKSAPDNRSGCRGRLCYMYFWWIKSRRSLVYHPQLVAVYHQHEVLYLIKPQLCSLRLMICACGDDIHAGAWWYTKPAAWIKKEVTFGRQKLLLFWWTLPDSNRWPSARQADALASWAKSPFLLALSL